jgi:hypothetical protein
MNFLSQPTAPTYLQDSLKKQGALGWWYHLMAYHLPEGQKPTLRDQEIIRRSRLATFVLVVQLLLIEAPVIPVVAVAPNHAIVMPWLLGCVAILFLAFACNRLGRLTLAGLLMVVSIEVTVGMKILTIPGGIGVANLPQFDILIQPVLLAVVLLPPWSAFVVAGLNIAFILWCLFAGPHELDLTMALHNPTLQGDILAVPVMAQCIIATVAFLIVANLLSALKRASKAEQIALLEHDIAQSRAEIEKRNQDLEQGIAGIVQTIQSATGSHPTYEKVILPPGNVLWPVIQQIWLFLDRYQRARLAEHAYEATVQASTELLQYLEARQQGRPIPLPPRRGTPLDGIIFTLGQMQRRQQREAENFSGPLTRSSNT